MSTSNMPPLYRAWLEKSAHNMRTINAVLTAQPPLWDIVCFHAQQSAEKVLKAFLVFHGQQPQKTHVRERVLQECIAYNPTLTALLTDCTLLTPYRVDSRYPGFTPDPTEQEAQAVIAATERIRAAVLALLPA